jgi:membrane-anchored glycerophosphoryl diester phosphodiesterase (GDPDase)
MDTEHNTNTQSGSLQDGIAAPYDFTIMEVFRETWQRTNGLKGAVLVAVALIFIIMMVTTVTFASITGIENFQDPESFSPAAGVLNLIITLVSYPFFAGLIMMGLHRAVDAPVSFKMAFSYFNYGVPIIIASICMSIMIMLGMFLLVIPGLYLSIAYMFTLPLIVDKNMDFWQAMETSRKAVTQHWFKFFFISVLMGILYLVSIIPLGLGLIWTIPMFIALQGVLYRRVFGISSVEPQHNESKVF